MKRLIALLIILTLLLTGCSANDPAYSYVVYDNGGTPTLVPAIDGKIRISSMPYLYDIAEGNVTGHTSYSKLGFNSSVDTSEEDIWSAGGVYVFPTVAQQMELVSSSVEDDPVKADLAAGTGVHTVVITYLDASYVEHTETINLNGTAVVTTTAVNIFRVNALRASVVGTSQRSVGTIAIRNLADTPIYRQILPLMTRGRELIYTVPEGKTLFVTSVSVSSGYSTVGRNVKWTGRATYNDVSDTLLTFFMPFFEIQTQDSAFYRDFEIPLKFPEHCDIKMSAISDANNSVCTASLRGWQENQ